MEAIAEKAELEQRRADFHGSAEQRLARIAGTGQTIPWKALQTYLRARAAGARIGTPTIQTVQRCPMSKDDIRGLKVS